MTSSNPRMGLNDEIYLLIIYNEHPSPFKKNYLLFITHILIAQCEISINLGWWDIAVFVHVSHIDAAYVHYWRPAIYIHGGIGLIVNQ